MLSINSVNTPLVEKSKLDKDLQGKPVDATLYRGMIGSLMYLTSSRLDLTYAVCLCARLSTTFKPKELTFQVALDVLSLTSFYQAFLISASVPAIYMHELWDLANLPDQKFVDPSFEEELLAFMRELGYPSNIKSLSDVKVEILPQPWRKFGSIINKCLSGKVTGLDLLRLSRAKILWGMYYKKNVDYVYLMWEDLVYQIKNKEAKKNKCMCYPRFTKVIINHFMLKDQSILRRNKVDWHMANDDPILTTMRFIPKHETVQIYGAILPDTLTNQAMKESDAEKTVQAPKASLSKRLKATAKVAKSGKKKLPVKGLETLPEVALSEAEQMQIPIKRSKTRFHISQASGLGTHKGTGVIPGVPDHETVQIYGAILPDTLTNQAMKESDAEKTVQAPKASLSKRLKAIAKVAKLGKKKLPIKGLETLSEVALSEAEQMQILIKRSKTRFHSSQANGSERQDKEAQGLDLKVQIPSHFESTDDEVTQGDNDEEEKLDEEKTNKEEESSSVSSGFISNMLNHTPDAGIDSILNLNTESNSLVDVPVTTNDEIPPLSITTLPPSPIPPIHPLQQTLVFTSTIAPSTSLQNLPTFGSLFKFEDKVKALEDDFLEFKQTNLFAEAVSSIPDFINKLDENKKKIIKEQVKVQVKEQVSKILPRIEKLFNEQLKAEVLTPSSNEAKTSHVVAANISELELKKILIDKIESNKSIHRSDQQKNLYKALIDAYETNKIILETYRDTVTFKRRQDDEDEDEDEEPSAGSNWGSTDKYAQVEKEVHIVKDLEEPAHQEFKTGFTKDHTIDEITQHPDRFQKPARPPTFDRDLNKTLHAAYGPI
nr:hypothetical protein [Tanacetum cinerariifolium]